MKSLNSSLDSLKELITIISGLAIANAVLFFLTEGSLNTVSPDKIRDPERMLPFLLLLFNLLRFYHGNMRHLDELKVDDRQEFVGGERGPIGNTSRQALWSDYLIIVSQHTVFVVASVYLDSPEVFFPLLSAVLFLDLFMFAPALYDSFHELYNRRFVLTRSRNWRKKVRYEIWMLVNNLVVGLVLGLGIGGSIIYASDSNIGLYVFTSFLALNFLLDYIFNWRFYFPTERHRIFLAAPFTWQQTESGDINPGFQAQLEDLMGRLEGLGGVLFSSHEREIWGTEKWTPEAIAVDDYRNMLWSDMVVAAIDDVPSGGVKVELGWASILGKPIFLTFPEGGAPEIANEVLEIKEKLKGTVHFDTVTHKGKFSDSLRQMGPLRNWPERGSIVQLSGSDTKSRMLEYLGADSRAGAWILCAPNGTLEALRSDQDLMHGFNLVSSGDIPASERIELIRAKMVAVVLDSEAPMELIDVGWLTACGTPLALYKRSGVNLSPLIEGLPALYAQRFISMKAVEEYQNDDELKDLIGGIRTKLDLPPMPPRIRRATKVN